MASRGPWPTWRAATGQDVTRWRSPSVRAVAVRMLDWRYSTLVNPGRHRESGPVSRSCCQDRGGEPAWQCLPTLGSIYHAGRHRPADCGEGHRQLRVLPHPGGRPARPHPPGWEAAGTGPLPHTAGVFKADTEAINLVLERWDFLSPRVPRLRKPPAPHPSHPQASGPIPTGSLKIQKPVGGHGMRALSLLAYPLHLWAGSRLGEAGLGVSCSDPDQGGRGFQRRSK
jgi:hypothetical protein